jgi:hypothetical protein
MMPDHIDGYATDQARWLMQLLVPVEPDVLPTMPTT